MKSVNQRYAFKQDNKRCTNLHVSNQKTVNCLTPMFL